MRYILSLTLAAAVLAAAWVWSTRSQQGSEAGASNEPASAIGGEPYPEVRPESPAQAGAPRAAASKPADSPPSVAPADPSEGRADALRPPVPPAYRSLTEVVWSLRKQSETWRAADYFRFSEDEALDAEILYVAFDYLRSCLGRPASAAQFEAQATRYERQHRRDPDRFDSEDLDNAMEFLAKGLERCQGLDQLDLSVAAYDALELSADLGFMPARLEYLRSAGRLLLNDQGWLFAHPEYVLRYRDRAEAYGSAVVALDVAEGYLAFAEFLMGGTLAPSDPIRAYAYALLADEVDIDARASAESALRYIGSQLDEGQKEEARALSRELCERFCRDR